MSSELKSAARSNTGHTGISEMVIYIRPKHHRQAATRHTVFVANWREDGNRKTKRFFYRDEKSRAAALKSAIQFRKEKTQQERTEKSHAS